jgi:OOP family OmpA-OmpF porin
MCGGERVMVKNLVCLLCVVLLAGCMNRAPVDSGTPLERREKVPEIPGYFTSPKGGPVKDAQGRCWRTADWRPALAIEECDPSLARERKLRELALKLSGVASAPATLPLTAPVEARFEGVPPAAPAAPAAVVAGESVAAAVSATTATSPVLTPAAPAEQPKPGYMIKPVVLNTDAAFFFGKDRLTVAGKDAVENLAAYIKLWGIEEVQVDVVGHSDRIGSAKDNLALSERRAEAVKQVLVEAGVPAASISATGVGSSQPVTAADTCPDDIDRCERINCLAPDRRVEVGLKGTRKAPVR